MTKEEAIEGLKENLCSMCAYGSQNMDSCDIRECDNRDYIKALEQQPSDDCVSRTQALKELKESAEHHANDSREEVLLRRDRDIIRALPPVKPTHGTCKNCKYLLRDSPDCFCCRITYRRMTNENFYCGNYEKREGEVVEMTREIWEERKNPPIDGKTDF